jgi:hypothetical protein
MTSATVTLFCWRWHEIKDAFFTMTIIGNQEGANSMDHPIYGQLGSSVGWKKIWSSRIAKEKSAKTGVRNVEFHKIESFFLLDYKIESINIFNLWSVWHFRPRSQDWKFKYFRSCDQIVILGLEHKIKSLKTPIKKPFKYFSSSDQFAIFDLVKIRLSIFWKFL